MDKDEFIELRASAMAASSLAMNFGMVAMELVAERHGREHALQLLERMEQQGLEGLTAMLNDSDDAQKAGRIVAEQKSAVFAAIRTQLAKPLPNSPV